MKLIMRADDLGFSEAVNYGIYKAVKNGVITCVGMMTNMEAAQHGYELLKKADICIGQHTNICVGRPVTDPQLIPSLVQDNGEFCTSRDIRSRKEDTIVVKEAEIEIEAQLHRFRKITGKDPDYFEAHAVFSKNFFIALKNVAEKYGLFFENPILDKQWEKEYGIKGFGFAQLDGNGLYDPQQYMNEHLNCLKENDCCIAVFHPGYLDQYILEHSSFTKIRTMECEFLCSQWLKDWLMEYQVQLVNFKNYKDNEV